MSSALLPCQGFNSLPLLSSQGAHCPAHTPLLTETHLQRHLSTLTQLWLCTNHSTSKLTSASLLLSFLHFFLSPSLSAQLLSAIFVSGEDTDMSSHDSCHHGAHSPIREHTCN